MSILLTRHGSPARRPRRRLTTFVSLLWLNLAMLPCTMAASGEQHVGKPDCPPSAAVAHHAHMSQHVPEDDHHGHHAGAGHSEQLDATSHPCESGGDCCELDDVLFSDAAKKLDRDSGAMPLFAHETGSADVAGDAMRHPSAAGPPPQYAGAVRRHALHCVYRD